MVKTKQQYFDQLSKLTQYQNKPAEEIMKLAERKVRENDPELDVASMFKTKDDKKMAKSLVGRYLDDFSIENIAEKNTLKQLIFLEVIQHGLQKQMEAFRKQSKGQVPQQILDSIHKNIKEIKSLKSELGIKKAEEEKSDAWKAYESLQRKAKQWREQNQGSRTMTCPHCGKMVMLRIRMEAWEAMKHPMFRDRILYNKHAFKLLSQGKISHMDVALILDEDASSTDYVEWILEKVQPKVENEGNYKVDDADDVIEISEEINGIPEKMEINE